MTELSRRWQGPRGGGKLGVLVALVVIAFIIHFFIQYIPPTIRHAELEGAVEDNVREYTLGNMTGEALVLKIMTEGDLRLLDDPAYTLGF